MPEPVVKKEVIVIRGCERKVIADSVVVEAPLAIYLGGQKLVTLLCTPENRKSLALGYLRSGGLIGSLEEVASVRLLEKGAAVEVELKGKGVPGDQFCTGHTVASGGMGGALIGDLQEAGDTAPVPPGNLSVRAEVIGSLMASLQERAAIFKVTGGMHSAALADNREPILFFEDIGRHNAVDKIIGECLLQGVFLQDKMLLCSGRLGSEILLKAARVQLPLIASRAAPTSLSIDLAAALNITLVGFVRDGRLNVYTHPERVEGSAF